jgi:hypothetical protein
MVGGPGRCAIERASQPGSGWAGSPAGSYRIAPRPNAPSPWPSSSAASTPPPPSWAPPGRRCAKPSVATASACQSATPKLSGSGPSTPPASAPGGRPPRPWIRCSWRSTRAPSRPESGHRPSCMSGSAARSSTPSWAPTWSSSCTAKATRVGQPPGPGRSSDGPTAATGWPTNAPAVPSVIRPSVPTAPADPSSPRSGRWRPMPANLHPPDRPGSEQRFHAGIVGL